MMANKPDLPEVANILSAQLKLLVSESNPQLAMTVPGICPEALHEITPVKNLTELKRRKMLCCATAFRETAELIKKVVEESKQKLLLDKEYHNSIAELDIRQAEIKKEMIQAKLFEEIVLLDSHAPFTLAASTQTFRNENIYNASQVEIKRNFSRRMLHLFRPSMS